MGLNKCIIQGRLTRDAELRYTNSQKPVATFTLAVDRPGKDAGADFITCVAWNKTAEFVDKYFTKGQQAIVDGRLQMRKWEDKDGNKRVSAEVVANSVYFCGGKTDGQQSHTEPETAEPDTAEPDDAAFKLVDLGDDEDWDLPF